MSVSSSSARDTSSAWDAIIRDWRQYHDQPRPKLRVLSLGAGVQSSTLALMIAAGEVPMVDCAIFADTQWESAKVYRWLDWLETQLPFPVYRVTAGNIRENTLTSKNTTGGRFASIPWFLISPSGKHGIGRRQCTSEFKLKPIRLKKRELLGAKPRARLPVGSCETLIGISTDEVFRCKPSSDRWDTSIWPLIDLRMSRADCLAWMQRRFNRTPPKSSCLGCPYHSQAQWREIRADAEAWADVVAIDEAIRQPVRGQRGRQFMHAQRVPLAEVDLSSPDDYGQQDAFNNECEGMCGV